MSGITVAQDRAMRRLLVVLLLAVGCEGTMTMTSSPVPDEVPPDEVLSTVALGRVDAFGPSLLQRLTAHQLEGATRGLFGVGPPPAQELPSDSPTSTSYDNDATALSFSLELITEYEAWAWAVGAQVRRDRVGFVTRAGCMPTGPSDRACFARYVTAMSRRVFRRPAEAAEVDRMVSTFIPYAIAENDFTAAVELAVATWLQHPEFLYRVEAGDPAPGQPVSLSQHEIATRLAFLVTGLPPDELLLDAADMGALATPQGRSTQVQRLLGTPAAIAHAQRFHAQWLGFAELELNPTVALDARAETAALVEQLVTDPQRDWLTLLTAKETFVTPALASHYGLPSPGTRAGWVRPAPERGGGILGHATFAVHGKKQSRETFPSQRGYVTYKRFTCERLWEPPASVDPSMPPDGPGCKPTRYTMRQTPGCDSCHQIMDGIGFGLEQIGTDGEWRTTEVQRSTCAVTGEGQYQGTPFTGPSALAELLVKDPRVQRCLGEQLLESMAGRNVVSADGATLDALRAQYVETRSYGSMLVALARSPSIAMKVAP
jgi:hypothetical protein